MSSRFGISALFITGLTGCQTVWDFTRDDDGDGVSVAQGDCWDAAEGPTVTLPDGSTVTIPSDQIYAGAPDQPYDGVDADCAGNDDFDLDGDGYVPLDAHVGLPTLGVEGSGQAHIGAGDCFDAPNEIVSEGFEGALALYAAHNSAQASDLSVDRDDAAVWIAMGQAAANALGTDEPLWVLAVPAGVNSSDTLPVVLDQLRPEDVHPDAGPDAFYDGIDVDCDGAHEFDQDGDGFETAHHSQVTVADWYAGSTNGFSGDDCIDSDGADPADDPNPASVAAAAVNPDAEEAYWTGTDEDCNPETVDCDFDGDGSRGDPTVDDLADSSCGFGSEEAIDCDDEDPTAVPNDSDEVYYNGIDENCDLADLDGDIDGDGFFTVDYCERVDCDNLSPTVDLPDLSAAFDCWDDPSSPPTDWPSGAPSAFQTMAPLAGFSALAAADVHSDAQDRPYDGVDQDCRGWENTAGQPADFDWDGDADRNADDFTTDGSALTGGDCLDCPDACYDGTASETMAAHCSAYCPAASENPASLPSTSVYSGAFDEWYDGTDADCDGASDFDADRDGFDNDAFGGTDCYEGAGFDSYTPAGSLDPTDFYNDPAGPNPNEVIGDGLDHDCDDQEVCYEDDDDDGFLDDSGDTITSTTDLDCDDATEGTHTDPTTDCDDDDAGDYPGATEVVGNEDDEDCDGTEICFLDDDNDGYRPNTTAQIASADTDCQDPDEATRAEPTTDCDDDASTCNTDCATDADADGFADCVDACEDVDEDDYGADNTAAVGCLDGDGNSCVADPICTDTDCNDNASTCTASDDCTTDADADGIDDCVDLCLDEDGDEYGVDNTAAQDCVGTDCDLDAACTDTDCDDDASTCNTDCATDSDDDGFADCQDACLDDDSDNYGNTNTSATACTDASGATCVLDAACTDTDCDDDASTCNTDCATDTDADGFADCQDACEDDDSDNYGNTNAAATNCLDASGLSCVLDAVCGGTDCDDDASSCNTDCASDTDDDGVADCQDACEDDDGDNHGNASAAAAACLDASGASCVLDATCIATDCNDDASTCTTNCSTDADSDGVADCQDACLDADTDEYGSTNTSATACIDANGSSCVLDAVCSGSDCNDNASSCNTDCVTDGDADGFADCQDACIDEDSDNHGNTNSSASTCLTATGTSCVLDAVCAGTDCDDDASACNTDCVSDTDGDGVADCQDACLDADNDQYGVTSASAAACLDAAGTSCTLDPSCSATDCDDDASTCNSNCATDTDSDGVADCQDACLDSDDDEYGTTNSGATGCLDAAGSSCLLDAVCTASDCDDDASTCNTDCATDADADSVADCQDACLDSDDDEYGTTNSSAAGCLDASGASCVVDAVCLDTDCADGDSAINPGATEIIGNEVDDDCNTEELCYEDDDDDGYLDDSGDYVVSVDLDCDDTFEADSTTPTTDCDDTSASVSPGLNEGVTDALTLDGIDNDCDDTFDEGLLAVGDLLITEVMIDPDAVGDGEGEWVEIHNDSGVDLVLGDGWTLESGTGTFTVAGPLSIADGGYLLLARDTTPNNNHGLGTIVADFEYNGLPFNNGGGSPDDVSLVFDDPVSSSFTMTEFLWNQPSGFTAGATTGATLQLKLSGANYADPTDPANWCDGEDDIDGDASLDLGTPGSANHNCN